MLSSLVGAWYERSKVSVSTCQTSLDTSASNENHVTSVKAYMSFAKYCDYFLRQSERGRNFHSTFKLAAGI